MIIKDTRRIKKGIYHIDILFFDNAPITLSLSKEGQEVKFQSVVYDKETMSENPLDIFNEEEIQEAAMHAVDHLKRL